MHTVGGRSGLRAPAVVLAPLSLFLIASAVVTVGVGPVPVHPSVVLQVLLDHLGGPAASAPDSVDAIVWTVRLPRVLLAVVVGATLATAGVALQAMTRNVLADPYVLGVTSGASTGAAAAVLLGLGAAFGQYVLPVMAFAGALVATLAVLLFARLGGAVTSLRLVLAGIAIGYVLSSVTSFLIFASDSPEAGRSVLFWLLGSLNQARWESLAVTAVVGTGVVVLLTLLGGSLDAMASGDETALTVGVDADRMRLLLAVVVAVAVGAMVAVSGGIGFIGLVVPHLARALVGATHHVLVPVAALLGGVVLVWTDTLARTAFSPQELPIGIVTGLLGGPFLLILLQRMHRRA